MAPGDGASGGVCDASYGDANGRSLRADVELARLRAERDHIRNAHGLGTARGRPK